MSSESGFQQVRPLTRKKSDVIIDAAPSLSNLKLNGAVVYDENKDVNTFGLYSFSAQAPVTRKEVTLIPRLSASGGAIYSDGKLYVYDYAIDYGLFVGACLSECGSELCQRPGYRQGLLLLLWL